jgi:hypothetical protein
MHTELRQTYDREMKAFFYLERAHILGQSFTCAAMGVAEAEELAL